MSENPETQYTEYVEPINYFQSMLFALVGGLVGVIPWIGLVYFTNYILYIIIIFVGACAAFGAKSFDTQNRRGNIIIALIAVIATVIAIIVGDLVETAIFVPNFQISLDNYLDYLDLKFSDDPEQLFYYIGAIGVAAFVGFTKKTD